MMIPSTGIIETLILLVTTFKNDGIGAFGEKIQNRQKKIEQCKMRVDDTFTKFVATFKGNYAQNKWRYKETEESICKCLLILIYVIGMKIQMN